MSLILAIEPDSGQADVLRRSVPERVGGEMVLVTTTTAAMAELGKRTPDVVLFGRSITKKDQEAVAAAARSADGGEHLLTFVIPELRGAQAVEPAKSSSRFGFWKRQAVETDQWDPVLFAEQIATSVVKVEDARRRSRPVSVPATTVHASTTDADQAQWAGAELQRSWETAPAVEPGATWTPSYAGVSGSNGHASDSVDAFDAPLDVAALAAEEVRAGDMLAAELVKIRRQAEEKLNEELARVRAEADQTLEEAAALALESDRARQDAEARLETELARLREQAQQLRLEHEQARRDSESSRDQAALADRMASQEAAAQALDAEVARVRAETEARFETELTKVRDHAEQARLAQEQAQREAESIRDTAAKALEGEVARVRAEAETRLDAELVRVREQAEQSRLAQEQAQRENETVRDAAALAARTAAESAAVRALEAEVARVRAEAEAKFEAELADAREQANQMRLVHEEARRETDIIRDSAAETARKAAEQAAATALEAEVARVRAESEARFESELARLREQANEAQLAHERARRESDTLRDAAAESARKAAEETAAAMLQTEVSRVRAETEARFERELVRVREQAEHARLAQEQSWRESDAAREASARAARLAAEESAASALEAQLAKVTADTQARLEAELKRVRTEADEARAAQQAAQAEMVRFRDEATREARAATQAAQAAVAQARSTSTQRSEAPPWERNRSFLSEGVATPWYAQDDEAPEPQRSWFGIWSMAAAVFFVAAISFALGFPASLMRGSAGWLTGIGVGTGTTAAPTETAAPAETTPAPRGRRAGAARAARRPAAPVVTTGDNAAAANVVMVKESGFLSVFSRLPLEIYANGTRLGSTEDGQLLLPPGQHTLEVVNDQFNFRSKVAVNITLNEVTSHTVTMPLAGVRVTTNPGAEVVIEGASMGFAPLPALPIQIGTREVVVRHPELGERRAAVEVKLGQTADISLMLDGAAGRNVAPPTMPALSAPPAPRPTDR